MSNGSSVSVSMPYREMHGFYTMVTPINYQSGGHATGFYFIDDSDDLYLITNYHVVAAPHDNTIRIFTRPTTDPDEVESHDVTIHQNKRPTWIEHPAGPQIDIAAVPLDIDIEPMGGTRALHSGLFPPDGGRTPVGQRAVVVGYPIMGQSPYLPYTRDALISTPYGMAYRQKPCFATDADMHSGTSGSPVFSIPLSAQGVDNPLSDEIHLIGIHSATLPSRHDPEEGPLNLNIAWYVELLQDMIDID